MSRKFLLLAAASASIIPDQAVAQRTELKTELVTQQTPVWCWAATASMALELLGFPDINPAKNYQCGVVAAAFPDCDDDCTRCVTSLGSIRTLVPALERYRNLSLGESMPASASLFSPNYVAYPGWAQVKHSLDLTYPVIAGVSPDFAPPDAEHAQHTVLITGYDDNYRGTGEDWVILRDPYPYERGKSPYAIAGYRFETATGKVEMPWRVLRKRMNLTSAIFLERESA